MVGCISVWVQELLDINPGVTETPYGVIPIAIGTIAHYPSLMCTAVYCGGFWVKSYSTPYGVIPIAIGTIARYLAYRALQFAAVGVNEIPSE